MSLRLGRRYSRYISFPWLSLFVCLFFTPQGYAQDEPYLAELIGSARQQRLADDPYWHILLHYRHGLCGYESEIDDPAFFLAPDGKTNPAAELEATLRAFFVPQDDEKQAAVCRFAARYEWLKDRLAIDPRQLPMGECRSFERFMEQVKPESVSLIFPMAHLNSPASMFGHTLLTIDTANQSKLLAYAVSYSAFANETFGPLFAVKGLTGLYPGYFSIMPYYAKLQEYSDVDHRDIWEYPLNLTKPEIRRLMLHVRELDHIASDYYFFDENCSSALFAILEAARPSVKLTEQTWGWLIPLDSIRMIDRQGLITDVAYRPSRTTKIKYLASLLPAQAQASAVDLARGQGEPAAAQTVSNQDQITTVDLASEYLQYLYTKGAVPEATYQERFIKILHMRSRLGVSTDREPIPIPVQPDKGHRSNRLALGSGVKGDDAFLEVRIRPVYHELMDDDRGYVRGAQLVFTDLTLRCYPADNRVALESLDIIDILSLAPRDRFFNPVSWKIKTGFTRVMDDDGHDRLVYQINPGGGMAFSAGQTGMAYALFETGLLVGGVLDQGYAVGAGGSVGLLASLNGRWKMHLYARDLYYGPREGFNAFEAGIRQGFTLAPNQGLTLDLARRKTHGFYQTEARLAWNVFF